MSKNKKRASYKKGLWGEFFAALFLQIKGYTILKRRWKTHLGEIDIIAQKGKTLIMIEVKTRATKQLAAFSINENQRKRIQKSSLVFLSAHPHYTNYSIRYDVIYMCPWRVPEHIPCAWDAS